MTNPEAPTALIFEQVSKAFAGARPVQALEQVSLRIAPARVTGLIGPDGAGKTTLMRLAAGLLRADSGAIEVLGIDVSKDPLQVQSSIGYMPQRFGLYEDLTVQENLDLYADLQGLALPERPPRYAELMHMTGLTPFTKRLAGKLSGGMKQKLGLACTLVRPPRLLLLDEPTVGVDPVSRRELWQIVYRLVREQGMAVLLSTAYLDEAERCDHLLILNQGRLLGEGTPQSFQERMAGRSYLAQADLNKRNLQVQLSVAPGVVDAIIQGERVRLVMQDQTPPGEPVQQAVNAPLQIQAAPPRFEDWFIASLQQQRSGEGPFSLGSRAASTNRDTIIEVDRAQRRFGDFLAVKDVSFSVTRGEVFGLLGANGAGKSTLFRMLCGLLPASAGRLQVAGIDLRHARAQARQRIGYMAQRFSLYADMSVQQNLTFFARAYGLGRRQRIQRLQWALTSLALESLQHSPARDLPLGYKQRLALAAALLHEPEILFLDEPTSGVDPLMRREFWQRINELSEHGITVLVTTHFMEEAEYCDRMVVMSEGEILAAGTPEALKHQQRSAEHPDPTLEDAFIALLEQRARQEHAA